MLCIEFKRHKMNEQIEKIASVLKLKEVDLIDWEGNEGRARVEGEEFTYGPYLLFIDYSITAIADFDNGDYYNQPSVIIKSKFVSDVNITMFVEETAEPIRLSDYQKNILIKSVENCLQ